jgi:hypothetical protein
VRTPDRSPLACAAAASCLYVRTHQLDMWGLNLTGDRLCSSRLRMVSELDADPPPTRPPAA